MNTSEAVIRKIALATFSDKKILMSKYTGSSVFYFVGGQVKNDETDSECLIRKVPDEISSEIDPNSLSFLETFEDKADGKEHTLVQISLYTGTLRTRPQPNNDVDELRYFDSADDMSLLSAIAVHKIFPWLQQRGYII